MLGTARAARHEYLREPGATELIDYTAVDFTEVAGEIDLVGGEYGSRSLRVLRPDGR